MEVNKISKRLEIILSAIKQAEQKDWYGEVISLKITYEYYYNKWFDAFVENKK